MGQYPTEINCKEWAMGTVHYISEEGETLIVKERDRKLKVKDKYILCPEGDELKKTKIATFREASHLLSWKSFWGSHYFVS
jgi:hypothetical protein